MSWVAQAGAWMSRAVESFTNALALSVWDEHGLSYVEPAPGNDWEAVGDPTFRCVDPAQESATAPSYGWRGVLTLEDLERALGELTPDWIRLVRDADTVRLQTSWYLERGQAWTMPEGDPSAPWDAEPDTTRMLVVCHPDDRDAVRAIVDKVRGGGR